MDSYPDDADTNLAMTECAYDRIVMTATTSANAVGTWGVDHAFTDTQAGALAKPPIQSRAEGDLAAPAQQPSNTGG
jgi:hypothetical protein